MHTVPGRFSPIAYSSVVLAFVFNLGLIKRDFRSLFTFLALGFTLVADYFLVLLADSYLVAMLFFSVAQLAYGARIHTELRDGLKVAHLTLRAILSLLALALPFVVLGDGTDALAVVSVFYFAQLIVSCIFAFLNTKCGGLILPIGLLLFLMCDIFVGFGNLSAYLPIEPGTLAAWLEYPPINMAWVFYLPSQTLLGISLIKDIK
jgi:hypothetical protein